MISCFVTELPFYQVPKPRRLVFFALSVAKRGAVWSWTIIKRNQMRLLLFPVCLVFVSALCLPAEDRSVKVHEATLTLPTYDEGAPDLNPQFDAFYRNVFPNYPYTIRTPINKNRSMTPWRVIVLENEYLSCRILPDLGGHLQGCTDRITGQEVFYSNPAVRLTSDSERHEFYGSGIETSFPVAHSRVTGSPVDFGWSVSGGVGRVVVGDTDRTTAMTWRAEFILRAGSAVLEQRGIIYNGSPARRGYQWWVSAEVERDDPRLRIVYPTHWMLPHNTTDMTPWPTDAAGVDLSDVANHKTQIGLFAHLSHEPWMALYKPKFRSGVAHYADPNVVRGKKVWLFGNTDTYVQNYLTENFNSFVEMQAGEMETQPEFTFLLPEQTKTFEHYWMPFHGLGGVSRVTRDAVLNLSRLGHAATVELCATHVIKGAKLRLSDEGKLVWEGSVELDPRVNYAKTVGADKLTVDLTSASGALLLHHVEGEFNAEPYDPNAKNPEPVPPSELSDEEEASLERGAYHEQRDQLAFAWGDYQRGLKRTPDSVKLATAAGRVAVALNRYDDAVRILKNVAASSPEAAYYYGTALAAAPEQVAEAEAALTLAVKDPAYGSAAKLQLGLLAAREPAAGGVAQALKIIQELTAKPGAPPRLGALEVALLRRAGKTQEAATRLHFWLGKDPANNMLRTESTADDPALFRHLGADADRVLDIAEQYRQTGAYEDALKLLDRLYPDSPANEKEPGWALPQNDPLVAYFRGYLRLQLTQDPKPDFFTAGALDSKYIFPHRQIDYRILEAALAQNSRDALAHNFLADLYFDSFEPTAAIAEWRKALALERDLPALSHNLARALAEYSKEPASASAAVLPQSNAIDSAQTTSPSPAVEPTNATGSDALPAVAASRTGSRNGHQHDRPRTRYRRRGSVAFRVRPQLGCGPIQCGPFPGRETTRKRTPRLC